VIDIIESAVTVDVARRHRSMVVRPYMTGQSRIQLKMYYRLSIMSHSADRPLNSLVESRWG
jgi:hypothetical protein